MNDGKTLEFNQENFEMLLERLNFLRKEVKRYKYDHLTGLKMRKDFDVKMVQMYDGYEFEDKPFVFIMLDADGLHNMNRTSGYEAGDELLVSITDSLVGAFSECRQADIFRISGDEFAVLLELDGMCVDTIDELMKDIPHCTWAYTIVDRDNCFPSPSSVFKETDKNLTKNKAQKKSERV